MKWNNVLKARVNWNNPRYLQLVRSLINEIYPNYPTRGLGQDSMEEKIIRELQNLPDGEIILPSYNDYTGRRYDHTMARPPQPEEYVAMLDKIRAIIKRVFNDEPPQRSEVDDFELLAAKLGGRVIMRPREYEEKFRGIPKGRKRAKNTGNYGKVIISTDKFGVVWQFDIANRQIIISKGRARNLLMNLGMNNILDLLNSLVDETFYTESAPNGTGKATLNEWYEYTLNELNITEVNILYQMRFSNVFKNRKYFNNEGLNPTLLTGASEQDKKRISIWNRWHEDEQVVYAKINVIENGELIELQPDEPEAERRKMSAKRWKEESNFRTELTELPLLDKIGAFRSSNPDAVAQSALRFIASNSENREDAMRFFESYLVATDSETFFMQMIKKSPKLFRQNWRIMNAYPWAQGFFEQYDVDLYYDNYEG